MVNGIEEIKSMEEGEYRVYSYMELHSIKKDISSINDKFKIIVSSGVTIVAILLVDILIKVVHFSL